MFACTTKSTDCRLEEEVFENSNTADTAGNHQCALAGDHQEGWNPYLNAGTLELWRQTWERQY